MNYSSSSSSGATTLIITIPDLVMEPWPLKWLFNFQLEYYFSAYVCILGAKLWFLILFFVYQDTWCCGHVSAAKKDVLPRVFYLQELPSHHIQPCIFPSLHVLGWFMAKPHICCPNLMVLLKHNIALTNKFSSSKVLTQYSNKWVKWRAEKNWTLYSKKGESWHTACLLNTRTLMTQLNLECVVMIALFGGMTWYHSC